jgi:hypothetical protein
MAATSTVNVCAAAAAINPFSSVLDFAAWRGGVLRAPSCIATRGLRHGFRCSCSTVSRNSGTLKNALFLTLADLKKPHLNQHISTVHFELYGTRLFVPNQR